MPLTPCWPPPVITSISCLDGWSSCCLDSWRLRKQRPPFNGSENRKLHGRRKTVHRHATAGKARRRKPAQRKSRRAQTTRRNATRTWSGRVTRESRALDLEGGVFTWKDPKRIAASLKRSAEESDRRKGEPYRSALSMLIFY